MKEALLKSLLLSTIISFLLTINVCGQDGRSLYEKNHCGSCHSIGDGNLVGPDLEGITSRRDQQWLISFIKDSKTMINNGDEDAKKLFEEYKNRPMPAHNLSDAEVQAILAYIASGGQIDESEKSVSSKKAFLQQIPLREPDLQNGRELFAGISQFENGGPSCLSCHNVKDQAVYFGGTFAKDLSVAHSEGIVSAMLSSMPAMISAYRNKELTEQEVADLNEYLKQVKDNQLYAHPDSFGHLFLVAGILVMLVLIPLIRIIFKRTKWRSVREAIYHNES